MIYLIEIKRKRHSQFVKCYTRRNAARMLDALRKTGTLKVKVFAQMSLREWGYK